MKNITVEKIFVDATIGADLHDCIRDAVILAFARNDIVQLKHNQYAYIINPKDIVNVIATQRR